MIGISFQKRMEYSHIMNNDYTPLNLPTQRLILKCQSNQPFIFKKHDAQLRLSGAFGRTVWEKCAIEARFCERHTTQNEPKCQQGIDCLTHWLYKPFSEIHRRDFARPIFLFSPTFAQPHEPTQVFDLEVTLWGRHAIAAQSHILDIIEKIGKVGLRCEDKNISFNMVEYQSGLVLTIKDQLAHYVDLERIKVHFLTPLWFAKRDGQDHYRRRYYSVYEDELPLRDILANVAYEWAAWDIEDRQLPLDRQTRHRLACEARDAARLAADGLEVYEAELRQIDWGERQSRRNHHFYPLQGLMGYAELCGNLKAALPYLIALNLVGGGQKRAQGFGVVRLSSP